MKTLKDFLSIKEELDLNQEESVLDKEPKFLELHEESSDSVELISPVPRRAVDPPNVLIMRRRSIRQFPNGQKVALYYVDKIHKYVTVPYTDMQWSTSEEFELEDGIIEEDVIYQLKQIVEGKLSKNVKFKDGSSSKVDTQTAGAILKVHSVLNDENKKKFSEMTHKSKDHFVKATKFAQKHLK